MGGEHVGTQVHHPVGHVASADLGMRHSIRSAQHGERGYRPLIRTHTPGAVGDEHGGQSTFLRRGFSFLFCFFIGTDKIWRTSEPVMPVGCLLVNLASTARGEGSRG